MLKKIKKLLIPIYELFVTVSSLKKIELSKEKNNAIILLTPNYGNIGDLAIGYTQQKFLEDNLNDYHVVSISVTDTYKYLRYIKQNLKKGDVLFLVGGGSFGDLYPKADFGRVFLSRYFKKAKICFFPQTMFFTDTLYGRKRLKKTQKAFSKSADLTLVAREKISYETMKDSFNNRVLLSPDIVFSLLPEFQALKSVPRRKEIVFTLRADEEKLTPKNKEDQLIKLVKDNYSPILFKDTTIDSVNFEMSKAEEYIDDMFNTYLNSRLVITDRLHGMIFAVITGTPCIVLPNSNHKIRATYKDWLNDCNYVTLLNDINVDEVKDVIDNYLAPSFKTNHKDLKIELFEFKKYLEKHRK
jgi:pyruvyl transferase EpsI